MILPICWLELHQLVRLDHLVQRERRMDDGCATTGIQRRPHFFPQLGRDLTLLRGRARPHGRAGNRQPPHHDLHEVKIRDFRSAEKRDQHQTPIHPQRTNVSRRVRTSHHVQDHIDTPAAREFLDPGGEILGLVVDRGGTSEADAGGAFLVRSGGGINGGAELARQLNRGDADAAGPAMDQRLLTAA